MSEEVLQNILETLRRIEDKLDSQKISPPSSPLSTSSGIVEFVKYKKSVLIKGDTRKYKDTLKKKGASWNPALKGWIMNKQSGRKMANYFKKKYPDYTEVEGAILYTSESSSESE